MTQVLEETPAPAATAVNVENDGADETLCFVCLKWTAGYSDCRLGQVCDLQRAVTQPES